MSGKNCFCIVYFSHIVTCLFISLVFSLFTSQHLLASLLSSFYSSAFLTCLFNPMKEDLLLCCVFQSCCVLSLHLTGFFTFYHPWLPLPTLQHLLLVLQNLHISLISSLVSYLFTFLFLTFYLLPSLIFSNLKTTLLFHHSSSNNIYKVFTSSHAQVSFHTSEFSHSSLLFFSFKFLHLIS